ncbi:wall-associated receptor kinase 2-like [Hevea brasiliensis]|uniref:wall-associated receptor kinase 2-like n=1 Tax=Hevea brasiliensis TaxID=3981 RepID=UPI0025CD8D09|nr:wall-associated receptor kinase 2-like [Hevea brasiliensis]
MGLHTEMRLLLIHWLFPLSLAAAAAVAELTPTPLAKPGCPHVCGNLSIPYPFGTRKGCFLDDNFLITCNATTNKPFLTDGNIEVLDISLDGQLRIFSWAAYDCYDKNGNQLSYFEPWTTLSKFTLSFSRNMFIAVGCDSYAWVRDYWGDTYATGCLSICYTNDSVVNGSCSGIGCCQTSIPKGVKNFNITVTSYNNHTRVMDFNPCSYAFVVEDGIYKFSTLDLVNFQKEGFPVVLDWAIGNKNCKEARKNTTAYACKENSVCLDSDNQPGYLCNCSSGYKGNPYLANGCKEIDECEDPSLNKCISTANCLNIVGSYTCFCPKGYHGDGRNDVRLILFVGASSAVSLLFVIISFVSWGLQRRKINELKKKNFRDNGGPVLKQLLSKIERTAEKAKIFTEDEVKKATNNFNASQIVGKGGFGIVYKGTLDKKLVAIKKSRFMDHDQIEQFVNEVFVLCQIKHPSVVKLIGVCLETSVPLLVYEFIGNKTLHYHIHNEVGGSSMPWKTRLRIAVETADALAHMHSDAPIHIIHRDVKSENILLDDEFQAKVSDFGVSRLVPLDQTQVSTLVQGTLGYIDPEYLLTSLLNEKSDVYSFGVVLLELLTGQKALSSDRPDKDKSLAAFFIDSMKEDRLFEILHERVRNEGNSEQLKGVAELAKRCLRIKGVKRPTMKEVKSELEELMMGKCVHV